VLGFVMPFCEYPSGEGRGQAAFTEACGAAQLHYAALWQWTIDGLRAVGAYDADCRISIEYKPNEPRAFSLLPDCASTLLAIGEVGLPNLGVTLDFAHSL